MLRIKGIDEESRDLIIQSILEKGVSVNVHYIPLSELTFYKNMGYKTEDYPVAFNVYSREITLPTYYDISDEQIEEVINAVVQAVEPIVKKC
jgi:dTDP-4-amino-4,6-dideoxygalactose transaminase